MDKKKIISSLTMAGLMATTAAGAGVFAADVDPDTKALGEYSKLIENKVAVVFKLKSEDDTITGKDLKLSYPGKTVTVADDAVLKTGDVVYVNGEAKVVVIYGDTNGDGKINIMDSVTSLNHVKGKATLEGAFFAAADLNNNKSINIMEAVNVLNVVKGKTAYTDIATAPASETYKMLDKEITTDNANAKIKLSFDADPSDYGYTIYDNKAEKEVDVITKVEVDKDEKEATLTATLKEAKDNDKDQTYTLTVTDNKTGKVVSKDTIKYRKLVANLAVAVDNEDYPKMINANNEKALTLKVTGATFDFETKATVTLKDSAFKEIEGTATLAKDSTAAYVRNLNVSSLKDGLINAKVKLVDEYGNAVVKEYENAQLTEQNAAFVKNTDELKVLNVATTRDGSNLTAVKVTTNLDQSVQKNEIKNIYFMVKKASESAPSASAVVAADKYLVKNGAAYNNDRTDVELNDDAEYTVYVVVESKYGVQSAVASGKIAKVTAEKLDKVTTVAASDTVAGEITWADNNDSDHVKGYTAVLYNNAGVAIATKTVTTKKVNFQSEIKDYALDNRDDNVNITNYKVGVMALAKTNAYIDSDETALTEFTYAAPTLDAVTIGDNPIVIDPDTHHQMLKWTDNKNEAAFYNVKFYKHDKDDNPAKDAIKTVAVQARIYECDLTEAMKSLTVGKYDVKVTAVASSTSTKIDSVESNAVTTYNLQAPTDLTVTLASTNETAKVTFSEVDGIVKADKEANPAKVTYQVVFGVLKANGEFVKENGNDVVSTANVEKDPNYSSLYSKEGIKPDGAEKLAINTTYGFYAKVNYNGNEVARTAIVKVTTPKETINLETQRTVKNFVVVSALGGNSISFDHDNEILYIDGKEFKSKEDLAQYPTLKAAVEVLKDGDKIKINSDDVLEVELNNTNSTVGDSALAEAEVTLNTNNVTLSGKVNKVKLGASNEIVKANLSFATINEKVELDRNATLSLSTETKVKIAKKLAPTLNNVVVTLDENGAEAREVRAINGGLEITGNNEKITVASTKDVTVRFTGTQEKPITVTTNANEENVITLTTKNGIPKVGAVTGLVVSANAIANISNLDYTTLTLENGATVKTDDEIKIDGITITPNSGEVSVKRVNENQITVKGDATVKYATVENKMNETVPVAVLGEKVAKLDNENKMTAHNDEAIMGYTINSDKEAVVTVNGKATFTKSEIQQP